MLYPLPMLFAFYFNGGRGPWTYGRERGDIIICSKWSSFPSLTHFTKSACTYLLTVVSVGCYTLTGAPFLRELPTSNSRNSPQIAATHNDQLPWVRLTLPCKSCSEFPLGVLLHPFITEIFPTRPQPASLTHFLLRTFFQYIIDEDAAQVLFLGIWAKKQLISIWLW